MKKILVFLLVLTNFSISFDKNEFNIDLCSKTYAQIEYIRNGYDVTSDGIRCNCCGKIIECDEYSALDPCGAWQEHYNNKCPKYVAKCSYCGTPRYNYRKRAEQEIQWHQKYDCPCKCPYCGIMDKDIQEHMIKCPKATAFDDVTREKDLKSMKEKLDANRLIADDGEILWNAYAGNVPDRIRSYDYWDCHNVKHCIVESRYGTFEEIVEPISLNVEVDDPSAFYDAYSKWERRGNNTYTYEENQSENKIINMLDNITSGVCFQSNYDRSNSVQLSWHKASRYDYNVRGTFKYYLRCKFIGNEVGYFHKGKKKASDPVYVYYANKGRIKYELRDEWVSIIGTGKTIQECMDELKETDETDSYYYWDANYPASYYDYSLNYNIYAIDDLVNAYYGFRLTDLLAIYPENNNYSISDFMFNTGKIKSNDFTVEDVITNAKELGAASLGSGPEVFEKVQRMAGYNDLNSLVLAYRIDQNENSLIAWILPGDLTETNKTYGWSGSQPRTAYQAPKHVFCTGFGLRVWGGPLEDCFGFDPFNRCNYRKDVQFIKIF